MNRRSFIKGSAVFGGTLATLGPFQALSARLSLGASISHAEGYGPLENKGDLWLPIDFNYQIISVQGAIMSDGQPTPGIFDGMAAYPGRRGTTTLIRNTLIRNHENRERAGEQKVLTPASLRYNMAAFGGNTKLEVRRERAGADPTTGRPLYSYEGIERFCDLGRHFNQLCWRYPFTAHLDHMRRGREVSGR